MDDKDRLELTHEDLAEPDQAAADSHRLIIRAEDLSEDEVFDTALPAGAPLDYKANGKGGKAARFGWSKLFLSCLAGLVGALFAWLVGEIVLKIMPLEFGSVVVWRTGLYGLVVGGCLGAALAASEPLVFGNSAQVVREATPALLLGGLGGLTGGAVAEAIFQWASRGHFMGVLAVLLVRAVGWSLLGVAVGAGCAAHKSSPAKLRNGLIAGALGGLVGGAGFELIKLALGEARPARLLALLVLGFTLGLLMALVEEVFKQAWLLVEAGPMRGKQFILYKRKNTLGASPDCDVCLSKEPSLAPLHCVLENQGAGWRLKAGAQLTVPVNDQPVQSALLQDGDKLRFGRTVLRFWQRSAKDAKEAG